MEKIRFEKKYLTSLINDFVRWEADEQDLQCYFNNIEYMRFNILFANDNSVILDAGKYKLYIEWAANECPVYVDVHGEYTWIGKIKNSRFWALVERKNHPRFGRKSKKMGRKIFRRRRK